MISYVELMKAHLADYKRSRLGVSAEGVWSGNGRTYPHILPAELLRLNIIETIRAEFWAYLDAHADTLPLHTDFHHLNSSQAFAFNLLYPLLTQCPGTLPEALGVGSGGVVEWTFEAMPDPAERTSVDLLVELADGRRILIEVKLTESGFGTCPADEKHRRKLAEVYAPRLRDRTSAGSLDEVTFFGNYQLLRNLSHLDLRRGDQLVLLLPRANELTWQQAEQFYAERLVGESRSAVHVLAAEDLCAKLSQAPASPPRIRTHLDLLAEKYFAPA